jgi:hypothetical protein
MSFLSNADQFIKTAHYMLVFIVSRHISHATYNLQKHVHWTQSMLIQRGTENVKPLVINDSMVLPSQLAGKSSAAAQTFTS